ncbi:hypothetical protein SK500_003158 [Providencia stuartii]|nr:hypothetical protein [Providencia stuartii]EMD5260126.1 hypothetical protein [Providencia stuartii]
MKEIDVLLVYEHVSRELDCLILIKLELEKIGLTSEIIPIHFNRYLNSIRYKPKIVVLPYLYSIENPTKKIFETSFENVVFLNLHHEQFYNDGTKEHMMPKDPYSKDVLHLAWNENFHNDLVMSGVSPDKIWTLGNPRTDTFYLPPKGNISKYKELYKKFIFVPTTFSWATVDEEYFLKIPSIDRNEFKHRRAITEKAASKYFQDFYILSKKMSSYVFLLRPHPFEDINKFKELFLKANAIDEVPSNILINREGNVYDWLKISDLCIGWCTTVNLEASAFNIPNIIYHPTYYPDSMNLSFFSSYNIIKDLDSLTDIIESLDSPSLVLNPVAVNLFGQVDGKVAYRIAKKIKNELDNSTHKIKFKPTCLFNAIKSIYIDSVKEVLFKLNLLHLVKKEFTGILEDNMSSKKLKKYIDSLKKSI